MSIIEEWDRLRQLQSEGQKQADLDWAQIRAADPSIWDRYQPTYIHPAMFEFQTNKHKMDAFYKAILKKPRQKSLIYFITFTSNNKVSVEAFKYGIVKQLEREIFSKVKYSFEHEDTNIHCHAYVTATHTINKDNFKSTIRKYGNMDIKHIKVDNGIEEYMSKENEVITLK